MITIPKVIGIEIFSFSIVHVQTQSSKLILSPLSNIIDIIIPNNNPINKFPQIKLVSISNKIEGTTIAKRIVAQKYCFNLCLISISLNARDRI